MVFGSPEQLVGRLAGALAVVREREFWRGVARAPMMVVEFIRAYRLGAC